MTNAGMFDEVKKDKHIARLKNKVKKLNLEIKTMKMLSNIHQKMNGRLSEELNQLKKDYEILKEGNEALGIYRKQIDPAPALKKLVEKQTIMVKGSVGLVKKHPKNWLLKHVVQNLIKITIELENIYNKLTRKN